MKRLPKSVLMILAFLVIAGLITATNVRTNQKQHEQYAIELQKYQFSDDTWIEFTPTNADNRVSGFSTRIPAEPWHHDEGVTSIEVFSIGQHTGNLSGEDYDVWESFYIAVNDIGEDADDDKIVAGALEGISSRFTNKVIWSNIESHQNESVGEYLIEKRGKPEINQLGQYIGRDGVLYHIFLNYRRELPSKEIEKAFNYFQSNFQIK